MFLSNKNASSRTREKTSGTQVNHDFSYNIIQVLEIMTAADSKTTSDVKQGKQRSQNNRA